MSCLIGEKILHSPLLPFLLINLKFNFMNVCCKWKYSVCFKDNVDPILCSFHLLIQFPLSQSHSSTVEYYLDQLDKEESYNFPIIN